MLPSLIASARLALHTNKAVYTTASVAYGWAGEVTQVKLPFGVFFNCVTIRPMDRPTKCTSGPMDQQIDQESDF